MVQLGPYGAVMDPNVGTGFENAVTAEDEPDAAAYCKGFAALFAQDPKLTADLLNTSQDGIQLNFALYTVYRPAVWHRRTGADHHVGQRHVRAAGRLRRAAPVRRLVRLLHRRRQLARRSASGAPMLRALDYAAAANADATSPYYKKLDTTRIGSMGHSQGGGAAAAAANDSRVKDTIIFNATDTCTKPFLAVSGDMDITGFSPASMASAVGDAEALGAWLYFSHGARHRQHQRTPHAHASTRPRHRTGEGLVADGLPERHRRPGGVRRCRLRPVQRRGPTTSSASTRPLRHSRNA